VIADKQKKEAIETLHACVRASFRGDLSFAASRQARPSTERAYTQRKAVLHRNASYSPDKAY
jgi:hypothetical protein